MDGENKKSIKIGYILLRKKLNSRDTRLVPKFNNTHQKNGSLTLATG